MRIIRSSLFQIKLFSGRTLVSVNLSWLVVLPVCIWGIAAVYVPILGDSFTHAQTWLVTFLIVLLMVFSLASHILGHLVAANLVKANFPERIPLFLFGDTAQAWPASPSFWKEGLVTLSGSFINIILAGLAYLVWNAQLNIYLNLAMPIIAIFNLWLAIINLAPVFPFDGGRLVHAITVRFWGTAGTGFHVITRLGYLAAAAETGWGIFLITQNARYSLETGLATIAMALLTTFGLMNQPGLKLDKPDEARIKGPARLAGYFTIGVVFITLAAIASSLLLTNNGLEAPGVSLSVEPMVEVPAQYRHQPAGTFLLTSVIQMSPIPVGGWMAGQVLPVKKILPPEKIVPRQQSPQESARQGFQMLDQSITTATVLGLRLAGFNAQETGKGAEVMAILNGSPAQGIILPGDIITASNEKPVQTASDLINLVKTQAPLSKISLSILRGEQKQELMVSLMPPAQPGGSPRMGISIQDAGFDYSLPIPVKIVPQKIVGGPSAGLMFTLTVYNMLSPNDLTGGLRIAGTGTINPDGTVGPIGGVQQKVAAAEDAGAVYFLSPAENYADAITAANHIKVIKVTTVEDAIAFLRSLPAK